VILLIWPEVDVADITREFGNLHASRTPLNPLGLNLGAPRAPLGRPSPTDQRSWPVRRPRPLPGENRLTPYPAPASTTSCRSRFGRDNFKKCEIEGAGHPSAGTPGRSPSV